MIIWTDPSTSHSGDSFSRGLIKEDKKVKKKKDDNNGQENKKENTKKN